MAKTGKPKVKLHGQHGPQKAPQRPNAATRLCQLLKLSADTSLMDLMRDACEEIVRLRDESAKASKPSD